MLFQAKQKKQVLRLVLILGFSKKHDEDSMSDEALSLCYTTRLF